MKELGITRGETFALRNQPVQSNGFYIETDSAYIGEVGGGYLTLDQYKAIGELLIDGANTAQKCGMLPSELLRQRDELREALERIANPIAYMERNLKEDERLNGMMAIQISNNAEYLKGIAEAAIKNTDG